MCGRWFYLTCKCDTSTSECLKYIMYYFFFGLHTCQAYKRRFHHNFNIWVENVMLKRHTATRWLNYFLFSICSFFSTAWFFFLILTCSITESVMSFFCLLNDENRRVNQLNKLCILMTLKCGLRQQSTTLEPLLK